MQEAPRADTTAAITPASAAAFADAFFSAQMDTLHVPGAVFVMVQDTSVLLAQGYGIADLATGRTVDPATTLFQVASVSKLFTATAVLQLAEEGQLDLQTDVNTYLQALQVPSAFGEPVTLHHLLTHTAGFDERNIGYLARDAASVQPLGSYLSDRLPSRTLPPGTVLSYSNHGYGLAGLVVEAVSGQPFADYMNDQVMQPLGMTRSTFHLPLPDTLAPHLAQGYRWTGTDHATVPLFFRNVPPAGALSATAHDMVRFLLAHLNHGRLGDTSLLDTATVELMHRQQFTQHPRLPGMAYGFMEQHLHGHRALQHGGDVPGYRSLLFLLPDERTGFFVAYNASSPELRKALVSAFIARFYPATATTAPLTPNPAVELDAYTGTYIHSRHARKSLEKLYATFNESFYVWEDTDGYLVTPDGNRWVAVEPGLFRQQDTDAYLAFQANDDGRVTHLFRSIDFGGTVPAAYEKLAWYQTATFANEFYLSWLLFLLLTWVFWPLSTAGSVIWRRWKNRARLRRTPGMHAARWLAALFGASVLWFAIGFVQKTLQMVQRGGGDLLYGMPPSLRTVLWLPTVQAVLAIVLVGFTVQAWRKGYWGLPGRIHYTLFTLATLAWVGFAMQYNLIGHLY